MYKQGIEDDYQGERFITFSEASELFSASSYNKISKIVRDGLLQAYELPGTTRLRVRKGDLLKLIRPTNPAPTA